MKIPDKIYLDKSKITENGFILDAIVPDGRVETSDVCYIRKDALLAFLNERKKGLTSGDSFVAGERKMLNEIIEKIESL